MIRKFNNKHLIIYSNFGDPDEDDDVDDDHDDVDDEDADVSDLSRPDLAICSTHVRR